LDRKAGAGLKPGRNPDHDAKTRADSLPPNKPPGAPITKPSKQGDHETRYGFFSPAL